MKNKLNQPDVEQSTTLEPNITIGAWATSTSINTHIDTQRIIHIPHKLDKPNPIEEVKKEWEALGYIWVEQRKKAQLEIRLLNTVSEITIYTSAKMYECIDRETDIVVQPLTYQEHNLLTKTFRALGWEDDR